MLCFGHRLVMHGYNAHGHNDNNRTKRMLDSFFKLRQSGTDVRTEMLAGLTTFLTMAYIIFVNPSILGDAGMPKDAVFVATCLVAALGSAVMGLYANYPIAMAPGMGLNAYFAYAVVLGMKVPWQAALGAVFVSGCLFILVSVFGLRALIVNGIPLAAGGDHGRPRDVPGADRAEERRHRRGQRADPGQGGRPAQAGGHHGRRRLPADRHAGPPEGARRDPDRHRRRDGPELLLRREHVPRLVSAPPSLAPTLGQLDIRGALGVGILNVVLVFFLVELFDATGTLMGVASRAGLLVEGKMERLNKALLADSAAIVAGSVLGTSSTTAYIESAAGVQAGGRTGLTALTVAVLFLACLFIAPLAGVVPAYATAPALLFVACLMLRDLGDIEWNDTTEAVPAAITALVIPFTYSIAEGIAFGFITYAALKLTTGRAREVKPVVWVIAGAVRLQDRLYRHLR
jgi:AGZA family xanthine/uracil permease-like MFS transporter